MFKQGDKVKVKNYHPDFNGLLATVDSVDGYYVRVFLDSQPDNGKYPLDLLNTEVEYV